MQTEKTLRIFIIENDHQTRVDLRIHFEKLGHEVLSSATSIEAMKILNHILKPDLFLIGKQFSVEMLKILEQSERYKLIPLATILR